MNRPVIKTELYPEGSIKVNYHSSQGVPQVINWTVDKVVDGKWTTLETFYDKDEAKAFVEGLT